MNVCRLIELQNEFKKGWLKPCQLQELTGIPAADLLKKELEEEKILSKKKERLNRSEIGSGCKTKMSINLPNLDRPKPYLGNEGYLKITRARSTQKKIPTISSWKDYFTDIELDEFQNSNDESSHFNGDRGLKSGFYENYYIHSVPEKPAQITQFKPSPIIHKNPDFSATIKNKFNGSRLVQRTNLYETVNIWGNNNSPCEKTYIMDKNMNKEEKRNRQNTSDISKNEINFIDDKPKEIIISRNNGKTIKNHIKEELPLETVASDVANLSMNIKNTIRNMKFIPHFSQYQFLNNESTSRPTRVAQQARTSDYNISKSNMRSIHSKLQCIRPRPGGNNKLNLGKAVSKGWIYKSTRRLTMQ